MTEDIRHEQQIMHKNLFDSCKDAIDYGYYLEALFLEYAAIEGRLEVILGMLGMPCNKELDKDIRRNVRIADRIRCIDYIRKHTEIFVKSKLPINFFYDSKKNGILNQWVQERNVYIHGLYKNAYEYEKRRTDAKCMAVDGLEYCRLLYNETGRLKRILSKEDYSKIYGVCKCKSCDANLQKIDAKKSEEQADF